MATPINSFFLASIPNNERKDYNMQSMVATQTTRVESVSDTQLMLCWNKHIMFTQTTIKCLSLKKTAKCTFLVAEVVNSSWFFNQESTMHV